MLFNSYPFAVLVFVTFVIYYLIDKRLQIYVLLASSIVFYGYSQPYLLILLLLSGSVNAVASYFVFYQEGESRKKGIAVACVLFNLLVLASFKYNHLFDGLQSIEKESLAHFLVMLPLPIGISFYTFQGISLVMDIYKPLEKHEVAIDKNFYRHYLQSMFFISFFPQLVAGPIVKAHQFFPQIRSKSLKGVDLYFVYKALVLGYFLKMVIADNLKDQTVWIAAPYFETLSTATLAAMLFGYSMQIFSDFAGYSLIAIGTAALFGYRLPINFNFPYISTSISEFWRRWHISLSSWLKEYLYISLLGGNRKGNVRTYLNLIIVMFLGGLWHGAAISYGFWGLWHGVGLAFERKFFLSRFEAFFRNKFVIVLRMIAVFLFVSFGWLLFKLPNFDNAVRYLSAMWNNTSIKNSEVLILTILLYSIPVIVYHLLYLLKESGRFRSFFLHDYLCYSILLVLTLVNGGIPGAFVYFQF